MRERVEGREKKEGKTEVKGKKNTFLITIANWLLFGHCFNS